MNTTLSLGFGKHLEPFISGFQDLNKFALEVGIVLEVGKQ